MGYIVITALIFILGAWFGLIYLKNKEVTVTFNSLDETLDKRSKVVYKIINAVKDYMPKDKILIDEIIEIRHRIFEKKELKQYQQRFDFENLLTLKMKEFIDSIENYQKLHKHKTIVDARTLYTITYQKAAAEKNSYNAALRALKKTTRIYPGESLAKLAKVIDLPYFEMNK